MSNASTWRLSRRDRNLAVAVALVLLALTFPAAASAHFGKAAVSCTGVDFTWWNFVAGGSTVNYKVVVDNAPAAQGTFTLDQNSGTTGTLHLPLTMSGTHTVAAFSWWGPSGVAGGETRPESSPALVSTSVTCAEAPVQAMAQTPAVPVPAGAAAPGAASGPGASAPAPAAGAAPGAPPAQGVAGVQTQSPSAGAVLAMPSACQTKTVRVTVRGQSMRSVAFTVNGRHVRSVPVARNRRSITSALPLRRGVRSERVSARVSFRNGAPAQTYTALARVCSGAAVRPNFTG